MIVELQVPYSDKDEAKALGARWNPSKRVWFVKDPKDLTPFMRWLNERSLRVQSRPKRHLSHPCFDNNSIRQ